MKKKEDYKMMLKQRKKTNIKTAQSIANKYILTVVSPYTTLLHGSQLVGRLHTRNLYTRTHVSVLSAAEEEIRRERGRQNDNRQALDNGFDVW